ncbi:MAG TPA: helix-turn-helix domain-containing protein [Longimicrobiales bacterium]
MSPESLPVKLRQARGSMSLEEAAARSGISVERIRLYEEGKREPYGKTLRRLAEAYGVPAAELAAAATKRSRKTETTAAPTVRRRRRRRVAAEQESPRVEVPVEVAEGQSIRVVIELIIRPRAPLAATEPTSTVSRAAEPAPAPLRPEPTPTASRELVVASPPGLNGKPAASWPRPDPLEPFKKAYRDFRRERKG